MANDKTPTKCLPRRERLNLSTVFDVCDVGRGNLAISKLLAKNVPFLRSTFSKMFRSIIVGPET